MTPWSLRRLRAVPLVSKDFNERSRIYCVNELFDGGAKQGSFSPGCKKNLTQSETVLTKIDAIQHNGGQFERAPVLLNPGLVIFPHVRGGGRGGEPVESW